MELRELFKFDEELIETLLHNMEDDACGALHECREETCACFQLGRNGAPASVFRLSDRGFGFFWDPHRRLFATFADAVRANLAALETGEIDPPPADDDDTSP